jgi:hypothetical protein
VHTREKRDNIYDMAELKLESSEQQDPFEDDLEPKPDIKKTEAPLASGTSGVGNMPTVDTLRIGQADSPVSGAQKPKSDQTTESSGGKAIFKTGALFGLEIGCATMAAAFGTALLGPLGGIAASMAVSFLFSYSQSQKPDGTRDWGRVILGTALGAIPGLGKAAGLGLKAFFAPPLAMLGSGLKVIGSGFSIAGRTIHGIGKGLFGIGKGFFGAFKYCFGLGKKGAEMLGQGALRSSSPSTQLMAQRMAYGYMAAGNLGRQAAMKYGQVTTKIGSYIPSKAGVSQAFNATVLYGGRFIKGATFGATYGSFKAFGVTAYDTDDSQLALQAAYEGGVTGAIAGGLSGLTSGPIGAFGTGTRQAALQTGLPQLAGRGAAHVGSAGRFLGRGSFDLAKDLTRNLTPNQLAGLNLSLLGGTTTIVGYQFVRYNMREQPAEGTDGSSNAPEVVSVPPSREEVPVSTGIGEARSPVNQSESTPAGVVPPGGITPATQGAAPGLLSLPISAAAGVMPAIATTDTAVGVLVGQALRALPLAPIGQ